MTKVVEEVTKKQGEMSDGLFAKELGLKRVSWFYLRTEKRNPGLKFYKAVMRAFPDLTPFVLMEMNQEEKVK